MAGDKFNFNTASTLVQVLNKATTTLEDKNEKMSDLFTQLGEGFKDDGYSKYESDIKSADQSITDIISQLKSVTKSIAEYAVKLREVM